MTKVELLLTSLILGGGRRRRRRGEETMEMMEMMGMKEMTGMMGPAELFAGLITRQLLAGARWGHRAGHLRPFWNFFNHEKGIFLTFFYQVSNLFPPHRSYLKSPLPVKLA